MATPDVPTIYKRKYSETDEVTLSDLRQAYRVAAQLVAKDGDKYLPLFERLDQEIEAREHQENIKAKAFKIAKQTKSQQPHNKI